MKDVKIVVGANYGDEGKGLITRHFGIDALSKGLKSIVIFHNGTAQRGHTVDYSEDSRHIYHHFGSCTGEDIKTYYSESFFIHPMEYHREYRELLSQGIYPPNSFYDPKAKVVTPYDMLVDIATEDHIENITGQREYASCGFGSWCAIEDRYPLGKTSFFIRDFKNAITNEELIRSMLNEIFKDCLCILAKRGVDLEKTRFSYLLKDRSIVEKNFIEDLKFFFCYASELSFEDLYNKYDSLIFENGQGLGLDMNVSDIWHSTSNTGIVNPVNMLGDKKDFDAEVCYVTRSYVTRHGIGKMENGVPKEYINSTMVDKTNVPNDFQGILRYGYYDDESQKDRIAKDFLIVDKDSRYKKSLAITHTNEFDCENYDSKYVSDNPFYAWERK